MKVRDLLNQFDLFLKISDEVMEIEIEGDFESYSIEHDDEFDHTYYVFEDNNHHVELSETNDKSMLCYATFPEPNAPWYVLYYNALGFLVARS